MDTTIHCPQCGQTMTVAQEHFSRSIECPHCRHTFTPGATVGGVRAPRATAAPEIMRHAGGGPLKNKVIAGLLGIFLGGLGVHRFYLGHIGVGVLQIVVTAFGCVTCIPIAGFLMPVGPLWGFIEGVLCLTGHMKDAEGRPLAD